MPTPTDPTNSTTGSAQPPSALQPNASTSPAFNQTAPAAGAPAQPDLSPFLNTDVNQSTLAQDSDLGADLTSPATPSFIPETPADMPQATEWEVTPEQTVAGQFKSIMTEGNPVFEQVRQEVMRNHQAAGGQNSLMASRSAAMAVADVGFKIASQDAATFARSAEFNAAMKNQFGLAEQQFRHNALLSEQNFKQGIMMVRENHLAELETINANMKANLNLAGAQAAIDLNMEAAKHVNVLAQMDRAHRQNLETMEAQFQYNWATNEQTQRQTLERMDRETTNTAYLEANKVNWNMQLNYMSEVGQNSRQLMATVGAIGSNPNITAAQASAAIADAVRQYNAVNAQLAAVYTLPADPNNTAANYMNFMGHAPGYGTNTGQTAPQIGFYGGTPGQPTGGSPAPGTRPPTAAPIAAPAPFVAQPTAPVAAPVAQPIAAPAPTASQSIASSQWFASGQAVPQADRNIYNSNPAYKQAWDTVWAFHNGNFDKTSDRAQLEAHLRQEYDKAVAAGVPTSGGAAPAPAPAPYTQAAPAGGGSSGGRASTARTSMK